MRVTALLREVSHVSRLRRDPGRSPANAGSKAQTRKEIYPGSHGHWGARRGGDVASLGSKWWGPAASGSERTVFQSRLRVLGRPALPLCARHFNARKRTMVTVPAAQVRSGLGMRPAETCSTNRGCSSITAHRGRCAERPDGRGSGRPSSRRDHSVRPAAQAHARTPGRRGANWDPHDGLCQGERRGFSTLNGHTAAGLMGLLGCLPQADAQGKPLRVTI